MVELKVELDERSYPIQIGAGLFSDLTQLKSTVGQSRPVIISNETIAPLYLSRILDQLAPLSPLHYLLPDGEQFKTLESFERVNAFLLENNCGRDTCLIALGGGVIGDLTGFVAACYQRGIDFIQIPTTLLSQVDSSVGGKTAVNHPLGKNMIGAFYQPKAVFIDTLSLDSLPANEFSAGIAEVIKYGLIYDSDFFEFIEKHAAAIKKLEAEPLNHIIYRCCAIKAEIVAQDEKESGIRALLNLGHTFGHAIESNMGYGSWLHGEAVAAGMVLAMRLSVKRGWCDSDLLDRLVSLLEFFQLPVNPPENMTSQQFIALMKRDKKNKQGQMRFILTTGFGEAALISDVTEQEISQLID